MVIEAKKPHNPDFVKIEQEGRTFHLNPISKDLIELRLNMSHIYRVFLQAYPNGWVIRDRSNVTVISHSMIMPIESIIEHACFYILSFESELKNVGAYIEEKRAENASS